MPFLLCNLNSYFCNVISLLQILNGDHLLTILLSFHLCQMPSAEPSPLTFTTQVWPLKSPTLFLSVVGQSAQPWLFCFPQSRWTHLLLALSAFSPQSWAHLFSYHDSTLWATLESQKVVINRANHPWGSLSDPLCFRIWSLKSLSYPESQWPARLRLSGHCPPRIPCRYYLHLLQVLSWCLMRRYDHKVTFQQCVCVYAHLIWKPYSF